MLFHQTGVLLGIRLGSVAAGMFVGVVVVMLASVVVRFGSDMLGVLSLFHLYSAVSL